MPGNEKKNELRDLNCRLIQVFPYAYELFVEVGTNLCLRFVRKLHCTDVTSLLHSSALEEQESKQYVKFKGYSWWSLWNGKQRIQWYRLLDLRNYQTLEEKRLKGWRHGYLGKHYDWTFENGPRLRTMASRWKLS